MSTLRLLRRTRGSTVVELDGKTYDVNGEGLMDGTWEIFPLMVYAVAGEQRTLVADPEERNRVVAALCELWDETGVAYLLERPEPEG